MAYKIRSFRVFSICVLSCIVLITLILNSDKVEVTIFSGEFVNRKELIPNIVHYVVFDKKEFGFDTYLSFLSVLKFQKPEKILIHSNHIDFNGKYWDKIKNLNSSSNNIFVNYLYQPTHVFGQKLSSTYHATDVARILVLQQWGGIYLDTDVLVLKNLESFRKYEMVVGWPEKEFMGTQILLAKKDAQFLKLWLEGYRHYKPSIWYYNAGQYPTEQILQKYPDIAYRVPTLFGVQNLLDFLYNTLDQEEWKEFYAIHLLSRHQPAPEYMEEFLIKGVNNTFGEIARYILDLNKI